MNRFIHKEFGTLEVADNGSYTLNGQLAERKEVEWWVETVTRAEDERERLEWDCRQRDLTGRMSWLRHPITRFRLERIYRKYRPILGPRDA